MTTHRVPLLVVLGLLLVAPLAAGHTAPVPTTAALVDGAAVADTSSGIGFAGPVANVPAHDTTGARDDFNLVVTDFTSAFGPETYKENDRAHTRSPDDVENQTTTWSTALGHRVNVTIEIEPFPGDDPPPCDTRFVPEAYIPNSAGRLYGYTPGTVATPTSPDGLCTTGAPGVRTFPLAFDIDGSAPTVTGSRFPALLPGVYAITLNLYHAVTPSPSNPAGAGPLAATIQVPFAIATPQITTPEPAYRFPESTLRLFTDVGANTASADEYAMLQQPLRPDANVSVTLSFPGVPSGSRLERIDHFATRLAPDLALPVDAPSGSTGEGALDAVAEQGGNLVDQAEGVDDRVSVSVMNRTPTLTLNEVPASGTAVMEINATQFASVSRPTGPNYVPLQVVTIHVPASVDQRITGAASLVVPVSNMRFPIREMTTQDPLAPGVQETGATLVRLQDSQRVSGGGTGRNAGDLFALRPLGFSHDLIAKTRLSREADPTQPWIIGQFPHATFPSDVGTYTMLAMVYGANDEFYGMNVASRGIAIDVDALRMVEGENADLVVVVTNLADDRDGAPGEADFSITVTLSGTGFPSGEPYTASVGPLVEGGSQMVRVPVAGSAPGTYTVAFTASAGELSATRDTTVEVISTERAREENRRWYDLPGPNALFVTLALAALVVVARRRV